jgi:SAM-dependent methyltransferase
VASFREIDVLDIRPLPGKIANVRFIQVDLMEDLPASLLESSDSLSCLHALEHFGLGRYGDPVKCDGHLRGLSNLHRILRRGGALYLSVPIGPQRIEFNAHRVFSVQHLVELCGGRFEIDSFSYVDDEGDLHEDVELLDDLVRDNYGCSFGCGIFEMSKL